VTKRRMVKSNFLHQVNIDTTTHVKVVAIIPCLNTQDSIVNVVMRTRQYVEEVIVVDDGSTDATASRALTTGAKVIRHDKNQGKGAAMKTAMADTDADVAVFIDGDGQHNPDEIPKLLTPILIGDADFVIGSRFLAGSRTESAPFARKIANYCASIVISCIISFLQPLKFFISRRLPSKGRIKNKGNIRNNCLTHSVIKMPSYKYLNGKIKLISDCTSGFTAMRKKNWDSLNLVSVGYQIETEIIFELAKNGSTIVETPIECSWKGSLSRLSVFRDGLATMKLLIKKLCF
jgi:glycosyltransferase involved in cell wall biosynthesis